MTQDEKNIHLWFTLETEFLHGEEFLPGWYYVDETTAFNGPFASRDEAELFFQQYCNEML